MQLFFKTIQKAVLSSTFILLNAMLMPNLVSANNISVSTYRIYLDQDNSSANFVVSNREFIKQKCKLDIAHYKFDETGNMSEYDENESILNAAEELFRFSPKSFDIDANEKQTVRFTLRRKSGTSAIEHRAYLVVNCRELVDEKQRLQIENNLTNIPIRTSLQHNIPIIVRPRKLNASASFTNVALQNNILSFDMLREGERSIYGKVRVLDINSNKIITESSNLVMYLETTKKSFHMAIPNTLSLNEIAIEFNELAVEGGDINVSWSNK